jgi:hypothetical protein
MNNTLWTFGDSYTAPFKNSDWTERYTKWKGYIPKVYGDIISENLGMELRNLAAGGLDNYSIFQIICDTANKIKPDDIIIIGWSNIIRFRVADDIGKWQVIRSYYGINSEYIKLSDISDRTLNEIMVNRENDLFLGEVCSWIKLLDYTFSKNKIIHWSPFHLNISKYYMDCRKCETITTETNGEITDGHYSEAGQVLLSEFLMEIINDSSKKKMI